MTEERCVICGEIIPEGRQICLKCERGDALQRVEPFIGDDCMQLHRPKRGIDQAQLKSNNQGKEVMQ